MKKKWKQKMKKLKKRNYKNKIKNKKLKGNGEENAIIYNIEFTLCIMKNVIK